ncbi:uncharacterized protein [Littorina saxatilis]|uniref:uncharacterized protein n=1 Tax=Littorina saxatilis TaxID=31220 RepID=UPI0038B555A0
MHGQPSAVTIRLKVLPNKLQLIFISQPKADNATYTCEGLVDGNKENVSIRLTVYYGINVLSPKTYYAEKNTDVTLWCRSDREDLVENVEWHRIIFGKWYPIYPVKYVSGYETKPGSEGHYLVIKNLQLRDTLKYVCAIDLIQNMSKTLTHHFVDVIVTVKPTITLPLSFKPVMPNVGDRLVMTCQAGGTPPPVYMFRKDNQDLMTKPNTEGEYIIESVKQTDDGDYWCEATNTGGSANVTAALQVNILRNLEATRFYPDPVRGAEFSLEEASFRSLLATSGLSSDLSRLEDADRLLWVWIVSRIKGWRPRWARAPFFPEEPPRPPPALLAPLGCGYTVHATAGLQYGHVASPNYPQHYPEGIDCTWYLLNFPKLDLFITDLSTRKGDADEKSMTCKRDQHHTISELVENGIDVLEISRGYSKNGAQPISYKPFSLLCGDMFLGNMEVDHRGYSEQRKSLQQISYRIRFITAKNGSTLTQERGFVLTWFYVPPFRKQAHSKFVFLCTSEC